ncbi:hypothetical protein [Paracoccus aminovorans]|uniref:hypothetical protein n=1 Tax=Paracoccus aminovorans TaxID=34004 RepID=UPI002B26213D|nr:hypothetical protein [Paracoccus aminovorans]
MTDKSRAQPNRPRGVPRKSGTFRRELRCRYFLCNRKLRRPRDSLNLLLRRVIRDCWGLSAIVAATVFLPPSLMQPLPAWYDPVAISILTLALGIAVLGWASAILHDLRRWPGFRLGLTVAVPVGMALLARFGARDTLGNHFGVSPDTFPVTLDVLTAVTTVWLTFAGVGSLLMLLLFGLLALQILTRAGAGKMLLRLLALVLPLSAMAGMPLASAMAIMPDLAGVVRTLDGQERHRCNFPALLPKPATVIFLSDTQVLAWLPETKQPVILPCGMAENR